MKVHESVGPRALSALRQSPISALHNLDVTATDDCIILWGRVGSYYYKQLAQETVSSVAGTRVVVNNIRVDKANRRP